MCVVFFDVCIVFYAGRRQLNVREVVGYVLQRGVIILVCWRVRSLRSLLGIGVARVGSWLLAQLAQLIRLNDPHAVLFFQRQAPQGPGQLAGFDAVVFARDQFGQWPHNLFGQPRFNAVAKQ